MPLPAMDHAVSTKDRQIVALLLSAWETVRTQVKVDDETVVPRVLLANDHALMRKALEDEIRLP